MSDVEQIECRNCGKKILTDVLVCYHCSKPVRHVGITLYDKGNGCAFEIIAINNSTGLMMLKNRESGVKAGAPLESRDLIRVRPKQVIK